MGLYWIVECLHITKRAQNRHFTSNALAEKGRQGPGNDKGLQLRGMEAVLAIPAQKKIKSSNRPPHVSSMLGNLEGLPNGASASFATNDISEFESTAAQGRPRN